MSSEVLRRERAGAVELLVINRPDAGNAMSSEVTAALEAALDAISADDSVRAVVITGAGDRYFCAGGDIKKYRELRTREQLAATFEHPRRLLNRIERLPLPVIAAINGYALGGGAELAVACDIRVAAPDAQIGFPQVRLGIILGWQSIGRLARHCGHGTAMQLLGTGEPVSAAEAHRIGLVNEVVSSGDVREGALAFADHFSAAAPKALADTKRLLLSTYEEPPEHARRLADEAFEALWLSEDHREAEAAFAEKRPPAFKGR